MPPTPILNRVNTYKHHPKDFLYLAYVKPCLDVDLFMTYLCDLFFFFTLIIINQIISLKQNRHTSFFANFFRIRPVIFGNQKKAKKRKENK